MIDLRNKRFSIGDFIRFGFGHVGNGLFGNPKIAIENSGMSKGGMTGYVPTHKSLLKSTPIVDSKPISFRRF
jgi:hypothetical protein